MPANANKCIACSSLQDWRRYFGSTATVLSLLVALTSVLSFAIPIWKETLVPKVANTAAALVEVDTTGLATFAISNSGNAPSVLENILIGADKSVVEFELESLTAQQRIIRPNEVNVFSVRLRIANTEDNVWRLVQVDRSSARCELLVNFIASNGKRTTAVADATTAELEESSNSGCSLKISKLAQMTIGFIGNRAEYVPTLCRVAALHPRDPANPSTGSMCAKSQP